MTRRLHRPARTLLLLACFCVTVPLAAQAQGGTEAKQPEAPNGHENTEARKLIDQAEQIALKIEIEQFQRSTLEDVAIVKAKAGDFEGARKIARTLKNDELEADILRAIATTQMLAGDREGATKTVGDIATLRLKVDALCEIATAQLDTGNRKGALLTLQNAYELLSSFPKEDPGLYGAIFEIAEGQARAGDATLAFKLDDLFKGDPMAGPRPVTVGALGKAYSGDIAGARRKIASFPLDDYKIMPLEAIADVQMKSGDKQGAAATFKRLLQLAQASPSKMIHILSIARLQANRGDLSAAQSTLQIALDLALKEKDDMELGDIARTQAELGDVPGALKTLSQVKIMDHQFEARRAIARAKARAGDIPGALTMTPEQAEPYCQAVVLLGTAEGILERHKPAKKP